MGAFVVGSQILCVSGRLSLARWLRVASTGHSVKVA